MHASENVNMSTAISAALNHLRTTSAEANQFAVGTPLRLRILAIGIREVLKIVEAHVCGFVNNFRMYAIESLGLASIIPYNVLQWIAI